VTVGSDIEVFAARHRFAIVYDGECPFCSAYIRLVRLKAAVGKVELFDARYHRELVQQLRADGFEINEGMVVFSNGTVYFGEEAMHVLALQSTRSGLFNGLTAWAFSSRILSKILYPIFKLGRRTVLFLLGRSRI